MTTTTPTPITSHRGKRLGRIAGVSLETATLIGNIANAVLLVSLVAGLIATFFIVQTANIKEDHWDHDRETAKVRISELDNDTKRLSAEAEGERKQIAEANAQAEAARTEGERLRLQMAKLTSPRRLDDAQKALLTTRLKDAPKGPVIVDAGVWDGEATDFKKDIEAFLITLGYECLDNPRGDRGRSLFYKGSGVRFAVHDNDHVPAYARELAQAMYEAGIVKDQINSPTEVEPGDIWFIVAPRF